MNIEQWVGMKENHSDCFICSSIIPFSFLELESNDCPRSMSECVWPLPQAGRLISQFLNSFLTTKFTVTLSRFTQYLPSSNY